MNKSPILFSAKSLVLFVKFLTVYAAFQLVTLVVALFTDDNVTHAIPESYKPAVFVVIGVYLLILLLGVGMLWRKYYSWLVVVICIAASLYVRFCFDELVYWFNPNSI